MQLGSTLPRKVIKEYDPNGKFLLIVVLVGEEESTEVPDAPDALETPDDRGFEDEPDWLEEAPCEAAASCEESPLSLLA